MADIWDDSKIFRLLAIQNFQLQSLIMSQMIPNIQKNANYQAEIDEDYSFDITKRIPRTKKAIGPSPRKEVAGGLFINLM